MKQFSQKIPTWKQHLYSIMISCICMVSATAASVFCYKISPAQHVTNAALLYILALILIGRLTIGYLYGIVCSFIAVVLINMIFTAPYYEINFSLSGYPLKFIIMLTISIITSTTTAHLTLQAETIAAHEKKLVEAETEKMRANLLRAISHDLRTPLTGIIGNSSLFLEQQENLSAEEQKEILSHIYKESNWLLNMVENLLTVTRIQGDNFTINTSEEAAEEVIAAALHKLQKRYPQEVINVHFPEEFILLPMDAILMEQVTINLLENAIVHSHSTQAIDLFVQNHSDYVSFTIRDYGVGIPKNMLEHLFDEGAYIVSQISDKRKGMGIGLSICKTIITAHKGTLIGKNHAKGAEFIFTLPKSR